MAYFRTCEYCGCSLDPGERCDCMEEHEPAYPIATADDGQMEFVFDGIDGQLEFTFGRKKDESIEDRIKNAKNNLAGMLAAGSSNKRMPA